MNVRCYCILFFVGILITILSCTRSGARQDYTHGLVEGEEIEFLVDDSTSFQSNCYYVFNMDGKECLAVENEHKNGIDFYGLNDLGHIRTIKAETDGPNAIKRLYGFTIINLDSILFMPFHNLSAVRIFDMDGHDKGRLPITADFSANHGSMTRSPALYHRGKIYFITFPFHEYVYDLKRKTFTERNIYRPGLYKNKLFGAMHSYPNRTLGPHGTFLYSWGANPNIQVIDSMGKMSTFPAESDYFHAIDPYPVGENVSAASEQRFYMERDLYDVIVWDKYRKVYYRFARQGIPMLNEETGRPANGEDRPCSIIILDANFKKIGETLLSSQKYFVKDWFVSKKGLYVSTTHYLKPDLDESKMTFTRLDLKKL
jgi:hypothetical protein